MKCLSCGKEIKEGYKFCPKCGTIAVKEDTIHKTKGVEIEQTGSCLSQKILLWIGILALLSNLYLLFISDYNPENGFRYLPAILVIVGLSAPISFLVKYKNTDDEYLYAFMAAIVGLIISVIAGIIIKNNTNNSFLTDFFYALSSGGFSVFYLILLIVSLVISWRMRKYGIIAISFLIGFLSPMIIAAIIYLLFVIIGIVLVIIFALGNKGGAAGPSSRSETSAKLNEAGKESTPLFVYDIEYEDERGYIKSGTKSYRKQQSYDQVEKDFRQIFWGNGINIRITNIKERKYT